ncbi:MAG: helix-turn-helix transcriptional regulator [Eubacterium sp.]|nr:helix-turn-helix transcriptional regulator [Eubacterium sp.]
MKHLRQLREEKGISQQKLANMVSVSQQSIYKYENGLAEPDFQTLIKLADYFETSVDYLIDYSEIRRKYEELVDVKLSTNEEELIIEYRKLPTHMRQLIQSYINEYNNKSV